MSIITPGYPHNLFVTRRQGLFLQPVGRYHRSLATRAGTAAMMFRSPAAGGIKRCGLDVSISPELPKWAGHYSSRYANPVIRRPLRWTIPARTNFLCRRSIPL